MILGLSNDGSDVPSSLLVTEISAGEKKTGLVEDLSLERNIHMYILRHLELFSQNQHSNIFYPQISTRISLELYMLFVGKRCLNFDFVLLKNLNLFQIVW